MSNKITFKELVEKISAKTKQSEQSTNDFIHELAEIIESSLGAGEKISIAGFGKFELRWMDERNGRNPQTGEEITIPGQNKVVFKPYKALRESVNAPFENLESQVIGDEPDDHQTASKSPVLSYTASNIPTPSQKSDNAPDDSESDLIVERESPVDKPFRSTQYEAVDLKPEITEHAAETDDDLDSVINQKISQQDQLAKDIQNAGNYRWSYTAAALFVLLAIFLIVFLMNRPDQSQDTGGSSIADQTQTTQVEEQPQTESSDQPTEEPVESQSGSTDEADNQNVSDTENDPSPSDEVKNHSVASGESLWTIAQNEYNDPYLWPLIYSANSDALENPNQLFTGSTLQIPALENSGDLSQTEREKVALGYISVYDWILKNKPDDARYYLWAAGSFSQEVLQEASENVKEADLVFATQG